MTSEVSGLVRRKMAEAYVRCTDVCQEKMFRLMVVPAVVSKGPPEHHRSIQDRAGREPGLLEQLSLSRLERCLACLDATTRYFPGQPVIVWILELQQQQAPMLIQA